MNRLYCILLFLLNFFYCLSQKKYDAVKEETEGLFAVQSGLYWGFIDSTGKEIIMPQYREAMPFSEGWALVTTKDYDKVFINKKNKVVLDVNINYNIGMLKSGMIATGIKGEYTYIDKTGKELFPREFSQASDFKFGLALVKKKWTNNGIVINIKGESITPNDLNVIAICSKDRFMVYDLNNAKYGVIDGKAQLIIPMEYSSIYYREETQQFKCWNLNNDLFLDYNGKVTEEKQVTKIAHNLSIFQKENPLDANNNLKYRNEDGYIGLLNEKKDTILKAKYTEIKLNNNLTYSAYIDRKYQILSSKGDVLSSLYTGLLPIKDAYITILDEKYGMIDAFGKELLPPVYTSYKFLKDDLTEYELMKTTLVALTKKTTFTMQNLNEGFILFNNKGRKILSDGINFINELGNNFYTIENKQGRGIMNVSTGEIIIPCSYKRIVPFGKGYIVQKNGLYGVIDANNKIVQPFEFMDIGLKKGSDYVAFYKQIQSSNPKDGILESANHFRQDLLTKNLQFIASFKYMVLIPKYDVFIAVHQGKSGVINEKGKTIIPCEYDEIDVNEEEASEWFKARKGAKWVYIDKNNKIMKTFE